MEARRAGFEAGSDYENARSAGFKTADEQRKARAGGFSTAKDFQAAKAAGFVSQAELDRAREAGFSSRREFEAAQKQGFETKADFEASRRGGFATKREYEEAADAGFASKEDFQRFEASGFGTKEEFTRAAQEGFDTKAEYDRAQEETRSERVRAASVFLTDVEEFLRGHPELPDILQIAEAVSALQSALPAGSLEKLRGPESTLRALLDAAPGFSAFEQSRQDARRQALQDATTELAGSLKGKADFARGWIRQHVTAAATKDLLPLIRQVDSELADPQLEDLKTLAAKVDRVFADAGLRAEYEKSGESEEDRAAAMGEAEARKRGFDNKAEWDRAREAGFDTKKELDQAAKAGFSRQADYQEFRKSGFASKEELARAQRQGFKTKAEYDRAQAKARADLATAAATLLTDVEAFLRVNAELPDVVQIAEAVSALKGALPKAPRDELDRAKSRLDSLLQSVPGFSPFAEGRANERNRAREQEIAENLDQVNRRVSFIRGWVARNITAEPTVELIPLIRQAESASAGRDPEALQDLLTSIDQALVRHRLDDAYQADARPKPAPPGADAAAGATPPAYATTPENKFLLEGDVGDLILMFNASGSAPNVYKNIRGDIGFEGGRARLCHAHQPAEDPFRAKLIRTTLQAQGAKDLEFADAACAELGLTEYDVAIAERGELLRFPTAASALLAQIQSGQILELRTFKTAELSGLAAAEQVAALQIETDLENGARGGFGIIIVPGSSAILCDTSKPDEGGHGAMLNQALPDLRQQFGADPQLAKTSTDAAFVAVQRGQCGAIYAEAKDLGTMIQALRRDNRNYAVMPIWFNPADIDAAQKQAREEKDRIARDEAERKRRHEEAEALAEQRRKDAAALRGNRQRAMQERSGAQARALQVQLQTWLDEAVAGKLAADWQLFPAFLDWYRDRKLDHWELVDVKTEIEDYGVSNWKGRKLETIAIRVVVRDRNRGLGEYDDTCFLLGGVFDNEFSAFRDPIQEFCEDSADDLAQWKRSRAFESAWIAE
jgi:hypothetical protein